MSVFRRKMFGGGYAHRGTGITSGLVPRYSHGGPVSEHTTKEKFEDYMTMFRDMDIAPERKPFSRLAAASPALLKLSGELLSGTSYQGGLGGGLEILGKGISESAPLFGEAIEARREYEAADPEASLKAMALEMALQEKDVNKAKTSTQVYGKFGDNATPSYGFFTLYEDGKKEYETGGKKYKSFTPIKEPDAVKPETFKSQLIKIRKKSDPETILDAYYMSGNKGSNKIRIAGQTDDVTMSDYDILGDFKDKENIVIKIGESPEQSAIQTLEEGTNNIITQDLTGKIIEPGTFTVVSTGDEPKVYEDENYKVTIGGETYDTLGVQQGLDLFITDPRPDSDTRGKKINVKTIDDLESVTKTKAAAFMPLQDSIKLMNLEKEYEKKLVIALDAFKTITANGDTSANKIANYQSARNVLDSATTGTFAGQRAGFVKFMETFKINEKMPTAYNLIKEALKSGETVATEFLNAAAQEAFIYSAQKYDDRLNNTEVKKLSQADFSLPLSKEGQRLLIDINEAQDQIFVDGANLVRLLSSTNPKNTLRAIETFPEMTGDMLKPYMREDGTIDLVDATNLANDYVTNKLTSFGNSEEIKQRIDSVLGTKGIGDQAYFDTLGDRTTTSGLTFNVGNANREKQIKFLGYPSNGNFSFQGRDYADLQDKRPVYKYEYEKDGELWFVVVQF